MKGGWTTGGWARHHYAMMGGVPEPYRSTKNPLLKTEATFSRGAAIYHQNCASCHGDSGHGDGPAGLLLSPPPADLAWLAAMPMSQWDSYMNWTVSEGGVPFGTAMPAFKGALSREEIWAVIGYVQNQLPNDVSSGQPYGPPTRRWRCCYRW
jgi:mono/diheme cytochrome c family protein